jgi:hypothetical protein
MNTIRHVAHEIPGKPPEHGMIYKHRDTSEFYILARVTDHSMPDGIGFVLISLRDGNRYTGNTPTPRGALERSWFEPFYGTFELQVK